MKEKLVDKIKEQISSRILELGFDIEYVEFVKELDQNIFRIVLDKKDSLVSIDECELVSRDIEDTVDKFIEKEYTLEVSSPGVERQLKNITLYNKYIGNKIYIKLFKKEYDKKEFIGILENVDMLTNEIEVLVDDKKLQFNTKDISSAHTVYDFEGNLKQNKNSNLNKLKKF
ncbi:MAG: hypothetical protein RSB67_03230 [Clostridia bacterium]